MDIKTKILLTKFNNNSYFENLKEYVKDLIEKENMSYENLKYLYDNLYKGHSDFVKQNIYPVGEFLKQGFTTKEAEELASLLPDAKDLSIFCYDEKERGYKYNKIFIDLRYVYENYNSLIKCGGNKEVIIENIKNDIEITDNEQREMEVKCQLNEYITDKELKEYATKLEKKMNKIKNEFKEITQNDKFLLEHYKNRNTNFSNIAVASGILAGIDIRNIQRENNNLDGELEQYPFNEEQIRMIDKYKSMENTLDIIERYAEINCQEDEIEM